jgi:alanine racemase
VDTGMGRLGFPWETAAADLRELAAGRELPLTGVCTHLASAGNLTSDFADTQAARFFGVLDDCAKRGLTLPCRHMSNSAGILRNPDWDLDAVRPGILLYGYARNLAGRRAVATQPFLQWKTRVVQVKKVPRGFPVSYDSTFVTDRETLLATLDAGYADGYPRALSNRGQVLVAGRRCPVAGRVTMNLITVNLGPDSPARAGDEAVLIGSQGTERVGADDLAAWAGTISYEILTGIRTSDRRLSPLAESSVPQAL